eukprot:4521805-Alexandrium_andersonii.AAC.1
MGGGQLESGLERPSPRPRPRSGGQRGPPHVVRSVRGLGSGGSAPGVPPLEIEDARLSPGK